MYYYHYSFVMHVFYISIIIIFYVIPFIIIFFHMLYVFYIYILQNEDRRDNKKYILHIYILVLIYLLYLCEIYESKLQIYHIIFVYPRIVQFIESQSLDVYLLHLPYAVFSFLMRYTSKWITRWNVLIERSSDAIVLE